VARDEVMFHVVCEMTGVPYWTIVRVKLAPSEKQRDKVSIIPGADVDV
jgi:hypothetical protein